LQRSAHGNRVARGIRRPESWTHEDVTVAPFERGPPELDAESSANAAAAPVKRGLRTGREEALVRRPHRGREGHAGHVEGGVLQVGVYEASGRGGGDGARAVAPAPIHGAADEGGVDVLSARLPLRRPGRVDGAECLFVAL